MSDVESVRVGGLERTRFIDKADGGKLKVAGEGPLMITGETDRVFLDTVTACVVDDPGLARRLRITKRDSRASVVWNPGRERASMMRDIGEDAWRRFVCVETANLKPHAVELAPRARHAMSARIDVMRFD